MKSVTILVLDDDMMHLQIMVNRLKQLDYQNVIQKSKYKDASDYLEIETPDLILIDHFLDQGKTSIDFMKEFSIPRNIPSIVFSSFFNEKIFDDIMSYSPIDFLSKNCTDFELRKSLDLAFLKMSSASKKAFLNNFFFIRIGKIVKKINLDEIQMIEVDGKYLNVYVNERIYIVRSTLSDFGKRLPKNFIKVHQSYIINFQYLEYIIDDENKLKLKNCEAFFSRNYRKSLLNSYLLF